MAAARSKNGSRSSTGAAGPAKRPRLRREMIVAAAAELFHRNGYQGTRIEDIGAAVGMSGPAVYRHFASKEALLTELLERAVERAQRDLDAALAASAAPRETLERIVRAAVAHAVEESHLVATAAHEMMRLPPDDRSRIARRQRRIVDTWVETFLAVRQDLDEDVARITAAGVTSMIAAAALVRRKVSDALRIERITRMALAALLAR
jgi:AcrR family transcriptional regulator